MNLRATILNYALRKRMEVGLYRPYVTDKEKAKQGEVFLSYDEITADKDGWVDCRLFVPLKFDLVDIDVGGRIYRGWWTGFGWDGYRVKRRFKPVRWMAIKGGTEDDIEDTRL